MAVTGVGIPESSIRFLDCELNAASFELRRGRRTIKLERIPLQVLLMLIQEHGKVVTREALADRIWGKGVFVDVDNGINTAIRKIRQVLNDDPQSPRFVETIAGIGYRFIAALEPPDAPVRAVEESHEVAPPDMASLSVESPLARTTEGAQTRGLWIRTAPVLLGLLLIAGIGGWLGWRHFTGPRHRIGSIAVLPLQNLSGDPSQEYFSDGMTEELITELSRIEPLRVISHTSVMDYKGTKKHLPEIARELGVDAILEGSVIREHDNVRVTVQLLDGPGDRHLWGEEYERPLYGVLNLQKDVARAVAQEVRAKLTPEQQTRFESAREVNPKAYENYLWGLYLISTQYSMREPLLQAKTFFENAIHADSNYAEAYSGLAEAHVTLAMFRHEAPDAAFQSAHDALRKAAELDDSIGEIHETLGVIRWRYDWDWAGAERELDRAISLAPSYACAREVRAQYLALLGRREDALAELRKVRSLDLGPGGHMTEEAVFYQLRDFPKLTETAKQGIAVNPNEWLEHYMLGIGYEGIGKLTEAIVEYKKAVELSEGDHDATASLAHASAASGDKLAAMKILHEWEAPTAKTVRSPYLLATIYAGLGQKDRAFAYLNQALRERNLDLPFHFRADPRIDSLRSDSRLQTLVSQMGFPIQR